MKKAQPALLVELVSQRFTPPCSAGSAGAANPDGRTGAAFDLAHHQAEWRFPAGRLADPDGVARHRR